MTQYAFLKDGEVVNIGSLPKQYNGTWTRNLTPEQLIAINILPYQEAKEEINTRTEKYKSTSYRINENSVVGLFAATLKTEEEVNEHHSNAMSRLRAKRDNIILKTDFYEMTRQISEEERTTWLNYRDELFRVPNTIGDVHPDDVIWPTEPN